MTHDEKIDWIRAIDAANIHIREADMRHACVGSQTVVAADALIRSQAEQIAALDTECLRLGIEEAKLQTKVEALTSERDALAAQWEERKRCHLCHGTGLARVQYGMIYDTDSADEIEDAYRSVECPACSIINPAAILAAHDAALVGPLKAKIVELQHEWNACIGWGELQTDKADELESLVAEKGAEILRLENSILEADDYRTETGERDTIRAYRHINAEAAGIREGREKIEREKS